MHIDYTEIKGHHILLVVDSYSKWLEVFPMRSTTSESTISVLRSPFARFGLPQQLVSYNGPQFRSKEFEDFLRANDIKHTLCHPYHPSSNGLAETFKRLFTLVHRIDDVLLHYRNTPHTTTGTTPAELFLKRAPRTRLSLVKPSLQQKVENRQTAAKESSFATLGEVVSYGFRVS